jgi:hypothetical protein
MFVRQGGMLTTPWTGLDGWRSRTALRDREARSLLASAPIVVARPSDGLSHGDQVTR